MSPTRGPPSERRTTLWSHWRRGARARADLIHNISDALTAVPLGIAFLLRSSRAEDNRALRRPRDARAGFRVAPIVVRAIGVWLGTEIVDPLVGLLITLVILKITWDPWRVATRTQPGELVVYGWPAALRSRDHPSGRRAPPAPPAHARGGRGALAPAERAARRAHRSHPRRLVLAVALTIAPERLRAAFSAWPRVGTIVVLALATLLRLSIGLGLLFEGRAPPRPACEIPSRGSRRPAVGRLREPARSLGRTGSASQQ